ncbi:DNA topoisomerase III [Paenibacillus chitinolyticus]|uniref:DNA topoisomerase III n=1 Tax=Paenibacillus chitinolyticus TaxID=79263 RepID=UPI001C44821C|nr:DNA topoisomerase III [Paenibacillus chitinolyticus]MBV6714477.1 DNA topoisomerase III [Paenibacillus chitinolyticus]
MSKSLVLAEKPSVAKEIARVLGCGQKHKSYYEGPGHVVTWALGHLVGLAEPEDYDTRYQKWNLEDLPIIPGRMKLKVLKETSHQFRAIADLAKRKDLAELIIATDSAREGELVARWIMEMVRWNKPFQRLWISSQTDKAIREGFANLKPGKQYDRLFQSAVCRAEADWLIGLNITRALTSKYDAQLSAGRVQTPTLGMIMDREKEIRNFRSVEYWTVQADFGAFRGTWRQRSGESRLFERERVDELVQRVSGKSGKVVSVKKTEKTEPQPLAYDLTELQRDANRRFGFSAKHTLSTLQRLYEQHKLVTYPRTDSRYLTSDMTGTLKERLQSVAVGPYAPLAKPLMKGQLPVSKRIVDDSKVSDHHAIIPTDEYVNLSALSTDERKLYDLIVRRFLALFYPAARYETTAMVVEVDGEPFHVAGRVVKDAGWRSVYGPGTAADSSDGDEEDGGEGADRADLQELPALSAGDSAGTVRCRVGTHRTQPPKRHTEATLLTQMEKHHLGTPATRAEIIEKLVSSDTIEREGGCLHPTGKGTQLIELVAEELRSPELTAKWEQELEDIARGRGRTETFLSGIRDMTKQLVTGVRTSQTEYKPHNLTNSRCPECGERLMERKSKRGKMLVCANRECEYRRSAEKQLVNRRCPQCHKKMELKTGKAGKYVQCLPCNVVEVLGESTGKVAKHQQQKLVKQYSKQEDLGSSLGDALKAALAKKDD